jgi:hypothetical protein
MKNPDGGLRVRACACVRVFVLVNYTFYVLSSKFAAINFYVKSGLKFL